MTSIRSSSHSPSFPSSSRPARPSASSRNLFRASGCCCNALSHCSALTGTYVVVVLRGMPPRTTFCQVCRNSCGLTGPFVSMPGKSTRCRILLSCSNVENSSRIAQSVLNSVDGSGRSWLPVRAISSSRWAPHMCCIMPFMETPFRFPTPSNAMFNHPQYVESAHLPGSARSWASSTAGFFAAWEMADSKICESALYTVCKRGGRNRNMSFSASSRNPISQKPLRNENFKDRALSD
mmetsp:Transcript_51021/g.102329  ORF Transcript_51021/g.102329 Transcript_51021/m.102329 type:complete len:236 (-) Transcript_51021:182-889(-)